MSTGIKCADLYPSVQIRLAALRSNKLEPRETEETGTMKLMTAREASEVVGVSLSRLYELVRQQALPCVRLGRRQLRFDETELTKWAQRGGTIETAIQDTKSGVSK